MIPTFSRSPDEYVSWMSDNAPHATVLDWWSRLDRSLHEYAAIFQIAEPSRSPARFERAVGEPHRLGPERASSIRRLRNLRNRAAHHLTRVSPEEAKAFAVEALELIEVVPRRTPEAPDAYLHLESA